MHQVPAWPFVVASFAFGIFALGPYFALWTPVKDEEHHGRSGPPKKSDLVHLQSHAFIAYVFK